MFGFGKKKETTPQRPNRSKRSEEFEERKAQSRAQLGFLVGIEDGGGATSGLGGTGGSFDVDDSELENELLMLLGDDSPAGPKPKAASAPPSRPVQRPKAPVAAGLDNLDFNINLEENEDDDGDLDDPDLQAELGEILGDPSGTIPTSTRSPELVASDEERLSPASAPTMTKEELVRLLQDRLELYEKAKASADQNSDSLKSRRFTRGLKTLKELLGKAKNGRVIDESEIPPVVSLGEASKHSVVPPDPEKFIIPIDKPDGSLLVPKPAWGENTSEKDSSRLSPSPQPNLPEPLKPIPTSPRRPLPPLPPVERPIEPPIDYEDPPKNNQMDVEKGKTLLELNSNPEVELRLKEYKKMAVILKRNQDTQGALNYLKLSKALEGAISSGQVVDLSQFPELPPSATEQTGGGSGSFSSEPVSIMNPPIPSEEERERQTAEASSSQASEETAPAPPPSEDIFGAPPAPKNVLEALEQRLEKYKSEVEKANSASNASKARRMGRIVKQYEEAIVAHKRGKPVPFDELPTPPGFAPIPHAGGGSGMGAEPVQVSVRPQPVPGPPRASVPPDAESKPGPSAGAASPSASGGGGGKSTSPGTGSIIMRATGKPVSKLTLQEKQLALITQRQKEYRDAAIESKKRGDINQAREYLRISKGFDNLIEASRSGLPVELSTLPAPLEALASLEAEDFELISEGDCIVPKGDFTEVFTKLEEDLREQLKMCMRMREHFKKIGDVASANRFEGMAIETKKDLDALRLAAKSGQGIPKYHYENRIFSITECNTDIRDDEIEITVNRGVNLKGTNSLDTFVRVELPYPTPEEAQSEKSHVVKDTTDPEYNVTYKMSINRSARQFPRFVHRHGVKVEIWSKGGLFRSSSLLGSANVKLQPLETKCNLHDAFEVLDGRKVVGKIEVKIRVRDPILTKQIIQKKEKWLSIDRA